ncbi:MULTISPECIES: cell division protein ZapD [Motilimonas]|uniref:Cell division protein ZapD n=1 Tax=Motilimonas cestriensis TaxID=2742685 RepID=A0ABS8WC90_9GAMM|nr:MULTISPECIES: cell division protein ZapD [Motilimonas]MCE2596110.1 cell division protein ZapD [Motilimonas cestriensis]MDO6524217.1 cell division protein ZapD [Motilimonas sp. 1_MG-2023]
MVIFEHPLNEKSRSYLRLEYIFGQIAKSRHLTASSDPEAFFKGILDLHELMERCEIRGDLTKDLEKHLESVNHWATIPGVDLNRIHLLQEQLSKFIYQLPRLSRITQTLKEDRFLSAVRQRFSIPGGLCSFDLPQLYFWLNLSEEEKAADCKRWLADFQPLIGALQLNLKLSRDSSHFNNEVAKNGFYQDNADNADMIRIKISPMLGFYPTVSGHKSRFAIRFLPHGDEQAQDIPFQIASC